MLEISRFAKCGHQWLELKPENYNEITEDPVDMFGKLCKCFMNIHWLMIDFSIHQDEIDSTDAAAIIDGCSLDEAKYLLEHFVTNAITIVSHFRYPYTLIDVIVIC